MSMFMAAMRMELEEKGCIEGLGGLSSAAWRLEVEAAYLAVLDGHEAGDDAMDAARRTVRGILSAIMEPDEGMRKIGGRELRSWDTRVHGDDVIAELTWQAMLSAITKGEG